VSARKSEHAGEGLFGGQAWSSREGVNMEVEKPSHGHFGGVSLLQCLLPCRLIGELHNKALASLALQKPARCVYTSVFIVITVVIV